MVVAFFDWRNLKMNDKNFIEELRQKREEYGVTQTRLAVACGISREYYGKTLIYTDVESVQCQGKNLLLSPSRKNRQ